MGITISLFQESKFDFTGLASLFRRKEINQIRLIMDDINSLILEGSHDNVYPRILNKLIQLTGSEYGVIGRINYTDDNEPEIHILAITNIAWNSTSLEFYRAHYNDRQCMKTLDTVFADAIKQNKPLIINKYDQTRTVLPPGHPPIRRSIVVPFSFNKQSKPVIVICLCNRFSRYKKKHINSLKYMISIIAYLNALID